MNYEVLVITSNFTIHQLFEKHPDITKTAIRRRFEIVEIAYRQVKATFPRYSIDESMPGRSLIPN